MRYRGKAEGLGEWPGALEEFRQIYNEQRPHEALQMKRPAERYRVSSRSYQAKPREWEYPSGSKVRELNAKGVLSWEGQQWFVCEALARRHVRVEEVAGVLLVSYPHMYVPAIDRQQRSSRCPGLPPEGAGPGPPPPAKLCSKLEPVARYRVLTLYVH